MTDIEIRNQKLIDNFADTKNSDNTKESYKSDLRMFAEYIKKDLLEVDIFDVTNYFKAIENNKSNATLRRYITSLKDFYTLYSLSEDYKKVNPTIRLNKNKYPVSNESESNPLTIDETKKIVKHIKKEIKNAKSRFQQMLAIRNLTMFIILMNTGMRISELLYLDFTELDVENWEIHLTAEKTKGKKDRDIDLLDNDISYLKSYLEIREEFFKGNKCTYKYKNEERELIFGSHNAKLLTPNQMNTIWKRYGDAVGIEGLHNHITRNSFITNTYEATGGNIVQTQNMISHSSINTTRRYIKIETKKIKDIKLKTANL